MALTPIKVLLFLAGGTVAAGTTAYVAGVFEPYLNRPEKTAEAPAPAETKVAALPPAEQPAETPKAPPLPPGTPAAQAPATPEIEVPTFDVVRVQGDGSIVIAGNAASKASVEAVIGSRVIGSAVAGAEGDFAIAVEERLKPGDYQIVLRSSAPDNVVATSRETAVVSIPEKPDGQVLALVEEPGKPSELIAVPETPQPKGAASPAQPPAPAQPNQPSGAPAAPGQAASTGDKPAAIEPTAPAQDDKNVAAAEPQPAAPKPPAQQQPADGPRLAVEAVEIEGRRIFVAGSADPGQLIRAYANEILLGQTETSPAGRFLVETERDLPVGDYIIRVDALTPNGDKVLARAAVPFEREAGENIAAVAPPAGETPAGSDVAQQSASGADQTTPPSEATSAAGKTSRTPDAAEAEAGAAPATEATEPGSLEEPGGMADQSASKQSALEPGTSAAEPSAPQAAPATGGNVAAPVETVAPKLQNVDSAVIIRRGDTLWRISKRVYGRGVRYSTIYLANQEQIRDPNMIWPGQVFSVPHKTGEGEQADMTRLGEQAVTPPAPQ